MSKDHAGKACPFCQAPMMLGVRASVCSACGTPHHSACWMENGGCAVDGCSGHVQRQDTAVKENCAAAPKPERAPAGRRYSFKTVAIVGLLAVVLIGGTFTFRFFWPSHQPGEISINPKDGAEMVWVPAGEFLMGSNDGEEGEKPQHTVYLDGYWMYKYEVTVAQYRKFCEATGRKMPKAPYWGWKDDHPIVNVSWNDGKAYADWAGARLPSEAEWEKAARGTDGRKYPWGNTWDQNNCANRGLDLTSTVPVGSYVSSASPYGCMDMAGNVWEWCADWYDGEYYKNAPTQNPKGPASSPGGYRVLRGGSWGDFVDDDGNTRCAYRNINYPYSSCIYFGFRLVR